MANGPRVFWCQVVNPDGMLPVGEWKISARGPKSAAETFVICDCRTALSYRDGAIRVKVREWGMKDRLFAISTTVTAKEIK
jgi:hypothetical protein